MSSEIDDELDALTEGHGVWVRPIRGDWAAALHGCADLDVVAWLRPVLDLTAPDHDRACSGVIVSPQLATRMWVSGIQAEYRDYETADVWLPNTTDQPISG